MTDDTTLPFWFPAIRGKKLTAAFDGGRLSSDGGVMLLAAGPGTPIKVRVDGADEAEALDAIAKFFESGFQ